MSLYITEIKALDPNDNEYKTWAGPNVPGISFTDAQQYCQTHGLGYCKVTGKLVCEIGTKIENGEMIPNFNNIIDYGTQDN